LLTFVCDCGARVCSGCVEEHEREHFESVVREVDRGCLHAQPEACELCKSNARLRIQLLEERVHRFLDYAREVRESAYLRHGILCEGRLVLPDAEQPA